MPDQSTTAATSEEARGLIEALWAQTQAIQALTERLDRVLSLYGRQPDDPRYKSCR
jgi:hypothetical protein